MTKAPVPREAIAAVATPSGRGGIGIVRISGAGIDGFCSAILGSIPKPRVATYAAFLDGDGNVIDEGIALYFPAPHSYTGEPVLELQAHGGRVVLDLLLSRTIEIGARLARPGEFSERAFLNQKIDLVQAEAVADLIEASTAQAVRSATRALQGVFSARINELVQVLTELRVYVEAAIDFSDQEIDFLSEGSVDRKLEALGRTLQEIFRTARQGCLLRDGMNVVIAGKPNSGKSSLLNVLSGKESAIVTSRAGTTRDVLRETIQVDGMPLHVIDTAGLRPSDDEIEQEGMRRTREELKKADRILWMVDASAPDRDAHEPGSFPEGIPVTRILNKIDLTGDAPAIRSQGDQAEIRLSVKSGTGMELLYAHLKESMGYVEQLEDVFIARRRHIEALNAAARSIENARRQLGESGAPELVAEDLRLAQLSLSEITGAFTPDDLLGKIFASFCIGK